MGKPRAIPPRARKGAPARRPEISYATVRRVLKEYYPFSPDVWPFQRGTNLNFSHKQYSNAALNVEWAVQTIIRQCGEAFQACPSKRERVKMYLRLQIFIEMTDANWRDLDRLDALTADTSITNLDQLDERLEREQIMLALKRGG